MYCAYLCITNYVKWLNIFFFDSFSPSNAIRKFCANVNRVLYCICSGERIVFFSFRMIYINDLLTNMCSQVSLTDPDSCQKDYTQLSYDYEIRHHRPLRLKKKIYEFYTAPITKFWADSVCLCILSILDVPLYDFVVSNEF